MDVLVRIIKLLAQSQEKSAYKKRNDIAIIKWISFFALTVQYLGRPNTVIGSNYLSNTNHDFL